MAAEPLLPMPWKSGTLEAVEAAAAEANGSPTASSAEEPWSAEHMMGRLSSRVSGDLEAPRIGGLVLKSFADPALEAAFQLEQEQSIPRRGTAVALALLGCTSAMLAVTFLWRPRHATTTFVQVNLGITMASFLLLAALLRSVPKRASPWFEPALCVISLYAVCTGSMTSDRVAALLGVESLAWQPIRLEESAKMLLLTFSLAAVIICAKLTLRWCLVFIHGSIPMYIFLVLTLGSREHTHLVQAVRGDFPERALWEDSLHFTFLRVGFLLYVLAWVLLFARRNGEVDERQRFAAFFLTRKRLEAEKRRNRELWERQKELEQLATALEHGPDGVHKHRPSDDALGDDRHGELPRPRKSQLPLLELPPRPLTVRAPARFSSESSNEEFERQRSAGASPSSSSAPNTVLAATMAAQVADWPRIERMARRIRSPDYTLREFLDDCIMSFPELKLFLLTPADATKHSGGSSNGGGSGGAAGTSSGRTAEAEYQRTIGALFAVFWLLRLDMDGKLYFCYGADEEWLPDLPSVRRSTRARSYSERAQGCEAPLSPLVDRAFSEGSARLPGTTRRRSAGRTAHCSHMAPIISEPSPTSAGADRRTGGQGCRRSAAGAQPPASFFKMSNEQKRESFFENTDWSMFEDLVAAAGCARQDAQERIVMLLCLTAIHDIMKVADLLPTVQPEHAPYRGYAANVVIRDHDVALSYVMEHFQHLLPSYSGLPESSKRAVLFTQGEMSFNFGWFVQAEAPPGAVLSGFKAALEGGAEVEDIGLYFLHWITDLAGAEATPLGGAEKFVLKFPHAVLASFLWSIPFLSNLELATQTEVFQEYMLSRWRALSEQPAPHGEEAIALLRLALMAQGDLRVVEAFQLLPAQERHVLAVELARTGCEGQRYSFASDRESDEEEDMDADDLPPPDVFPGRGGPALLVYYGPALLQRHREGPPEALRAALAALARVLAAARSLWRLEDGLEGTTVTVQIGSLKAQTLEGLLWSPEAKAREVWVLVRHNEKEGSVELQSASALNALSDKGATFRALDFNGLICS